MVFIGFNGPKVTASLYCIGLTLAALLTGCNFNSDSAINEIVEKVDTIIDGHLSVTLMPLSKAFTRTSVNTSIFRTSPIVSDSNYQFVAYYDEDGYITIGKRQIDSVEWEIVKTNIRGDCAKAEKGAYYADAHKVISLGLDGEGYLHMCNDMHATKLLYRRSIAPYSCSFGELKNMISPEEEQSTTYPEFHRLKNGDLLFAYRWRGQLVLNEYSIQSHKWSRKGGPNIIAVENAFSVYWQMCIDKSDRIHLSWLWRENPNGDPESNHNLYYAVSDDGGIWKNSKGKNYQLPIVHNTAELAWEILEGHDYMNQTSMVVTQDGNPYVATYWRDEDSNVPQYRTVWHKNGKWYMSKVGNRMLPFRLSGSLHEGGATLRVPISRPKIVVDQENGRGLLLFRDKERGEVVSLAYCQDISKPEWIITDLTSFSVGAWEPAIDEDRWKKEGVLDVYVQKTYGEGVPKVDSEMAYILEVKWN